MRQNLEDNREQKVAHEHTKEIAEPVSSGGLDIADLGLAEHAAGEAEITFNT
jgi:hypothetical protein